MDSPRRRRPRRFIERPSHQRQCGYNGYQRIFGTARLSRNVTITPGGTTTDVAAGDYIITGTNIRGDVITETIAIAANASTIQTGNKAFASITSVLFPIQDGAAATFDVGFGTKLGLERLLSADEVIYANVDGAYEGTRPTIAYSASAIESNTLIPNTAANGAKDIVAAYMTTELVSAQWDTE